MVALRLRLILRDLEQLLNRFDSDDDDHLGRLVMLGHQLRATVRDALWPHLSSLERRRMAVFLASLADPFNMTHERIAERFQYAMR